MDDSAPFNAAQAKAKANDLVRRGDALEREGASHLAWQCLADAAILGLRARGKSIAGEWDGTIAARQPLTVVRLMRHVGAQLRMAPMLHALVVAGMKVTVIAEPRLMPLLARSFPQITVLPDTAPPPDGPWASYERVAQHIWDCPHAIQQQRRALRADPSRTARLRARYLDQAPVKTLIGLSWWSSNTHKDLPDFQTLTTALRQIPGTLVSVQYAPQEAGLTALSEALAPVPLLYDPQIDPATDLDASAAQIAAMDLVVSVSNTTVHMAGALGQRCILLMDDLPHMMWPFGTSRSVFYETVHVLRKEGRSWADTCRAAVTVAQAYLGNTLDIHNTEH